MSPKETASFWRSDITALGAVSWPAAGFLLPPVCCMAKQVVGVSSLLTCHELRSPVESKLLLNSGSVVVLCLVIIFLPEKMWYGAEGLVIQTLKSGMAFVMEIDFKFHANERLWIQGGSY